MASRRSNRSENGLTTPVVDAIGQIHFEGNIIPHLWYQRILTPERKPDLHAIILLAEVVYWYRPKQIRDEHTGKVTETRKRFAADKLQRTYHSFGDQFGLSWWQVKRAFDRMKAAGLVSTELRTVRLDGGAIIPNALFVEPSPLMIQALSDPGTNASVILAPVQGKSKQQCKASGSTDARAYTEISSETSPENHGRRGGAADTNSVRTRATTYREAAPKLEQPAAEQPKRQKLTRLNYKWPLGWYFGGPASPAVLKQLREAVEEYRDSNGYLVTQRDLNAAAVDGRAWWEINKEGEPKGIEVFLRSLRETVQPMLDAVKESRQTGQPPKNAKPGSLDLLTGLSAYLRRDPTPPEMWAAYNALIDWQRASNRTLFQFGYNQMIDWLEQEWQGAPRTMETFVQAFRARLAQIRDAA